jgi:dephospho-CoA kinase
MLVVGLTGGIGVGKTTVARALERRGAVVVDCDGLGRRVVEPDGLAYAGVVARFGDGVVRADGQLDRPALAAIVFNDPGALADLNGITHPAIDLEIASAIAAAPPDAVVVLDMAVLVETRLGQGQYEVVVVVEAPIDVRLERLAGRGMAADDARARIATQATDARRREVGDLFVDNGGDEAALERAVDHLWVALRAWTRPVDAGDL